MRFCEWACNDEDCENRHNPKYCPYAFAEAMGEEIEKHPIKTVSSEKLGEKKDAV